MNHAVPWPQLLRVRLDAGEMLRFARQEAFRDDDFPLTMTRRVIGLDIQAGYFLPELQYLEQAEDGWLVQRPGDLPKYLRVFGLDVPLPAALLEGERLWELKLSKYGGWDVFSINDQVLAVLGGDDLPPGPLPPGGMPLGVSFCARHSLTGLPATTRITELLIQCENALMEEAPQVICQMNQLQALQLSCRQSFLLPAGLPGGLRKLDLRLFRGKLLPGALQSLTSLKELLLSETASTSLCSSGPSSMALPGSLRRLILRVPGGTTELGFLRGLHRLQELELWGSALTVTLEPIEELHELEELSLFMVSEARDLNPLRRLKKLRRLSLGGMLELVDLSPLASLPSLRELTLILCDALSDVSPLAQLPSLRRLMLMDCDRVQDMSALESIPGLKIQR